MFSRRLQSALFIDFENIGSEKFSEGIGNLQDWLCDGQFEKAKRRRRQPIKRVYWNSSSLHYEPAFTVHGFETILCDKFHHMKNGADIRMAIDVVEAVMTNRKIEEVILITTDSDFVPIIDWLRKRHVEVVVFVNENNPVMFTAFSGRANAVIPFSNVRAALNYQRPQRPWFFRRAAAAAVPEVKAPNAPPASAPAPAPTQSTPTARVAASPPAPVRPTPAQPEPAQKNQLPPAPQRASDQVLHEALNILVRLLSETPNVERSRRDITRALSAIAGFSTTGTNPYLGFGNYPALMQELAKRDGKIRIQNFKNDGISVMIKKKGK